jgi:hypothetical protein
MQNTEAKLGFDRKGGNAHVINREVSLGPLGGEKVHNAVKFREAFWSAAPSAAV